MKRALLWTVAILVGFAVMHTFFSVTMSGMPTWKVWALDGMTSVAIVAYCGIAWLSDRQDDLQARAVVRFRRLRPAKRAK